MKTAFSINKTEAAGTLDAFWDEDSTDNQEMYDAALLAMVDFAEQAVDEAECDEDHMGDASVDDLMECLEGCTIDDLTNEQISFLRRVLGMGIETVADELKEEVWANARDRFSIAELEMRLK